MKEKRFFPEKGLLMLSGAAFLLLIVPAWVPGFVWCGVAAVLLCAAVCGCPFPGRGCGRCFPIPDTWL